MLEVKVNLKITILKCYIFEQILCLEFPNLAIWQLRFSQEYYRQGDNFDNLVDV